MQHTTQMRPLRGHGAEVLVAVVLALAIVAVVGVRWMTQAPAAAPPLAVTTPRSAVNRIFADEAAYVPSVEEYTSPALGEDYLPIGAPPARRAPPASRFFRDELAGAGAVTLPSEQEIVAPPLTGGPGAGPQ